MRLVKRQIATLALGLAIFVTAGCGHTTLRGVKSARYQPNQTRILRLADNRLVQVGNVKPPSLPAIGYTNDVTLRPLRSGDRLDIQIRGIPNPENIKGVVDENGELNMPYIGNIKVAGKTSSEAEKLIQTAYITSEIYKKNVTIIIVPPESEYVVQGEVIKPGAYPITHDITLMQALGRAGRYTEFADNTAVKLIRGKETTVVNARRIEKGQDPDISVKPGDVIIVPRTWY